jgi:hypothetical protein
MKTCVLAHYAFKAGAKVFCTELPSTGAGFNFPDVALIDSEGLVTEVEVKVSLSDLKRDFKKRKYRRSSMSADFLPDRFLFAVPDFLDMHKVLSAVGELDRTGRSGVIAVTLPQEGIAEPLWFSGPGTGAVRTVKPALDLRAGRPRMPKIYGKIQKRLMSELVSQRYLRETYLPALAAGMAPGARLGGISPANASAGPARKAGKEGQPDKAGTSARASGADNSPGTARADKIAKGTKVPKGSKASKVARVAKDTVAVWEDKDHGISREAGDVRGSKATKVPKVAKAPNAAKTGKADKAPKAPKTGMADTAPVAVKAPNATMAGKADKASKAPKTGMAEKAHGASGAGNAPGASGAGKPSRPCGPRAEVAAASGSSRGTATGVTHLAARPGSMALERLARTAGSGGKVPKRAGRSASQGTGSAGRSPSGKDAPFSDEWD